MIQLDQEQKRSFFYSDPQTSFSSPTPRVIRDRLSFSPCLAGLWHPTSPLYSTVPHRPRNGSVSEMSAGIFMFLALVTLTVKIYRTHQRFLLFLPLASLPRQTRSRTNFGVGECTWRGWSDKSRGGGDLLVCRGCESCDSHIPLPSPLSPRLPQPLTLTSWLRCGQGYFEFGLWGKD